MIQEYKIHAVVKKCFAQCQTKSEKTNNTTTDKAADGF